MFIKTAQNKRRKDISNRLSLNWLASNLSEKGFKEILRKIDPATHKDATKQAIPQEVANKNWRRLATAWKKVN